MGSKAVKTGGGTCASVASVDWASVDAAIEKAKPVRPDGVFSSEEYAARVGKSLVQSRTIIYSAIKAGKLRRVRVGVNTYYEVVKP